MPPLLAFLFAFFPVRAFSVGSEESSCSSLWSNVATPVDEHEALSLYRLMGHRSSNVSMLSLPVDDAGLFGIVHKDQCEPSFDPNIHLQLETPDFIERRGVWTPEPPSAVPKVDSSKGSELAFTAPFRVLSDEGVRAVREIIGRRSPTRNHRSYQHRGLYYTSPFIRDLCNDNSLLVFLSRLTGEEVKIHHLFQDAAFANVGRAQEPDAVVRGTTDPWHYDSVNFVAVVMLSDPTVTEGGELEVVRHNRSTALHRIGITGNNLNDNEVLTVNYGSPGKCIYLQGSEIVHRVTRVSKAPEPRVALGLAFQPANAFHPDKTSLDTFVRYDGVPSASFEFFRMKAHATSAVLASLALDTPSGASIDFEGRQGLAASLRAVGTELERVASLVEGKSSDWVGFVDESCYTEDKQRPAAIIKPDGQSIQLTSVSAASAQ